MSNPAPTADLSATSPSVLLGDPSAVQPPQIGVGRRGKGGRPSLDLLRGKGGNLSSRSPRAPGAPKSREEMRGQLQVLRPQQQPAPTPRQAPPDERPRTAAGAPIERPREIPKTGEAEATRDAARHGMSKDTRRFHAGISAEAQDQFNKWTRAIQDIERRNTNDEIAARFRALRVRALNAARQDRKLGKGLSVGDVRKHFHSEQEDTQ